MHKSVRTFGQDKRQPYRLEWATVGLEVAKLGGGRENKPLGAIANARSLVQGTIHCRQGYICLCSDIKKGWLGHWALSNNEVI
jgi:hypothetical protein